MLTEIITAYRYSAALYAFVKLGIPVLMGRQGPMSLEELSSSSNIDSHRLSRLLDVIAERGIVHKPDDCYVLAVGAESLADSNSLETLWILCELGEEYWSMWSEYPSSLSSAAAVSAFERQHGTPFFSLLSSRPELKENFDRLMAKITEELSTELIGYIQCDEQSEVVDVGGGKGALIKKLHERYNLKSATILDIHPGSGINDPDIDYIGGDFFTGIVANKDIYILKNILHDWDDANGLKILRNCYQAMKTNSKLFVIEIIKQSNSSKGKTLDLVMDALFLGKERFYYEYEDLAKAAGFIIETTVPTSLSQSVMVWRKDNS